MITKELDLLESEAIYIMREVASEAEKPVMLYSIGKDSSVMLRLAEKAFYPEPIPFPLMHTDTGWKFKEMIAFRNRIEYCRALSLKEDIDNHVDGFEENYNRLAEALKGNNRVLISDENLSAYSIRKYDEQHNPETYWREMARVIGTLGPSKTTVIVYLRRQDEYVVSSWKERVKGGYTDKTFREYLREFDRKYELDFTIMLNAIGNSFGSSTKIIVRSYNKDSSSLDGVIYDFCEALEIPWDNDYKVPTKKVNESLSFDATEAVRTCKYGIYGHSTEKERQERKEAIHTLSKKHPDTVGTTFFCPKRQKY